MTGMLETEQAYRVCAPDGTEHHVALYRDTHARRIFATLDGNPIDGCDQTYLEHSKLDATRSAVEQALRGYEKRACLVFVPDPGSYGG